MYVELPHRATAEHLARWRTTAARLDLSPGPGGSRITPAPVLNIDHDLLHLVGGMFNAAVIALQPSAQLVAHCDPPIRGRRYHLPLSVNDGCWVFHGGVWQQLSEGHVYEMDPTVEHGAVNWGTTVRLHLILDVLHAWDDLRS